VSGVGGGITRRLGVAVAGGGYAVGHHEAASGDGALPFLGEHQAGIATAAQDRLVFAAFDLDAADPGGLRALLRAWSDAAARLTQGRPAGAVAGPALAPPADTGEALDLAAARLTVTIGLGPDLFASGRLGLGARRPSPLRALGPLPGEQLDRARSGGDLCVQACADDPQVAFHAVRNLARIGRGAATLRWTQLGFGRTAATASGQSTPRNLQGFKDGTNNLRGDDADAMARFVWVGADEPQAWMRGGTYMVCRRIRMHIEAWDRASIEDQEQTIGRHKVSGVPLGGASEHDPVDLAALGPGGAPVIPLDAHIRLAAASSNGGVRLLRRGYSFTDGADAASGELDAGLFFICFQRDPHRQFAALQRWLGADDALNEYIVHTGSAVFAVPPGARPGGVRGTGAARGLTPRQSGPPMRPSSRMSPNRAWPPRRCTSRTTPITSSARSSGAISSSCRTCSAEAPTFAASARARRGSSISASRNAGSATARTQMGVRGSGPGATRRSCHGRRPSGRAPRSRSEGTSRAG
jgi:deferrochelatase/peroxidase EfeB